MKAFEYAAPRTEAEILQLLSPSPGQCEILAGGTDLVGLLKKMVVTPDRVVNIMEVPSLKSLEPTPQGGVCMGAAVTLDVLRKHPYLQPYPALTQAIRGISSMQLQAQGTIGGEICQRPRCWYIRQGVASLSALAHRTAQGDNRYHAILGNSGPAKFVSGSRLAPALLVLAARVRVLGPQPDQEQWLPMAQLFRIPRQDEQRETVLLPNQLITHIELPPNTPHSATYEVRESAGPDYPLAAAAAALDLEGRVVREARLALGQVAPIPWLSWDAAQSLRGCVLDSDAAERAGEIAVAQASPLSGNAYKVQLAKVAVKRAVLLAAGLETGGF